jgi:hypothetical protein
VLPSVGECRRGRVIVLCAAGVIWRGHPSKPRCASESPAGNRGHPLCAPGRHDHVGVPAYRLFEGIGSSRVTIDLIGPPLRQMIRAAPSMTITTFAMAGILRRAHDGHADLSHAPTNRAAFVWLEQGCLNASDWWIQADLIGRVLAGPPTRGACRSPRTLVDAVSRTVDLRARWSAVGRTRHSSLGDWGPDCSPRGAPAHGVVSNSSRIRPPGSPIAISVWDFKRAGGGYFLVRTRCRPVRLGSPSCTSTFGTGDRAACPGSWHRFLLSAARNGAPSRLPLRSGAAGGYVLHDCSPNARAMSFLMFESTCLLGELCRRSSVTCGRCWKSAIAGWTFKRRAWGHLLIALRN